MRYLLLDLLLLILRHTQCLHLLVQLLPVLLLLLLLLDHLGVALLDEIFGCFYFFLGGFGHRHLLGLFGHCDRNQLFIDNLNLKQNYRKRNICRVYSLRDMARQLLG